MHLHQLPRLRFLPRRGLVRAAATVLVAALVGCSAWSERPPPADASGDRTLDGEIARLEAMRKP